MKPIGILLFLLVFCFATAMQAQAPKPDSELKKFGALTGHWTYEGEYTPGPQGPGGKFTGDYTGQMVLGGFFFQGRWTEKGPAVEDKGFEIDGYDPVNKGFFSNWYASDGFRFLGGLTFAGNTYAYAGKVVMAGKQYQFRGTFVFGPDLTTGTFKTEISADGQTWTTFVEEKWTKAKPAPKK